MCCIKNRDALTVPGLVRKAWYSLGVTAGQGESANHVGHRPVLLFLFSKEPESKFQTRKLIWTRNVSRMKGIRNKITRLWNPLLSLRYKTQPTLRKRIDWAFGIATDFLTCQSGPMDVHMGICVPLKKQLHSRREPVHSLNYCFVASFRLTTDVLTPEENYLRVCTSFNFEEVILRIRLSLRHLRINPPSCNLVRHVSSQSHPCPVMHTCALAHSLPARVVGFWTLYTAVLGQQLHWSLSDGTTQRCRLRLLQ